MSEEAPLDEAIQLELAEQPLSGANAGIDVASPTLTGLQWLAVPSACVGLAYRIQGGTTLEAIAFAPDPQVKLSLELSVPAVNLACSSNGRLIVAACIDGSLQCFDATSTSLEPRWILPDAHSHVVQAVSQPVSSSRQDAAAKAGPIHSLAFAPSGYALLLADAGNQRLSIYNAKSSEPANLAGNLMTLKVLCAAWSTETSANNGQYHFAAGTIDGSIHIISISLITGSITKVSTIPALEDEIMAGFVPTHLDWFDKGKSLACGYCRCEPDDDGDDEDYDAAFYVGTIENYQYSNQTDLGEVVPFFSVPRNGRHVFFSSFAPANRDTPLLFVASNVASEVGVVVPESGIWQVIELQEGYAAACPTDEDDEFTFPMGIATVRLPEANSTAEGLLLASTDGSLSTFRILNQNNADAFCTPHTSITHGVAALPATPLEKDAQSPPTPPLSSEPKEAEPEEPALTEEATPAFGSGTSSGFSFGSGTAAPSFGSPAFGQPSALGAGATQQKPFSFGQTGGSGFGSPPASGPSAAAAPVFGSGGAVPVFGSGSSSGGGFAALASSPATGTGFGSSSTQSPFGAFTKSATESPMVKPLFGDSSSKPVEPNKTEVAPESKESTSKDKDQVASTVVAGKPAVVSDAPGAKKAASVFDSFDEKKAGILPLGMFEDMMDELGEGIYGDELDAQKALVDPEGTNEVSRSAFITWYVNFVASDDSDADSLDTEDREEREAEKQDAIEKFSLLATPGEGGKPAITKENFGKLIESFGTVYCEEEHEKTIKKLVKPDGMIYKDDFVAWYVDWIFGDGDDEDESDAGDRGNVDDVAPAGGSTGGWGGIFGDQASGDTWKCESCMVRNAASATACAACETPKPGLAESSGEGATAASGLLAAAGSSIGAGGFSFGGGSTPAPGGFSFGGGPAPTPGGFSFGSSPAPVAKSGSSVDQGGFSFQESSKSAETTEQTESTGTAEDKDHASPPTVAAEAAVVSGAPGAKKAASVFDSFDEKKAGILPLGMFEDMLDELGEGIYGDELDAQKALVDPEGTNEVSRSAFITWYVNFVASDDSDADSLDTEDREEREAEKQDAIEKFSLLATPGEGGKPAITKENFGKLIESFGTVYCEEEHEKTIKKLVKPDGMIYEDDFVAWYVDWIFGDGDDEDESDAGDRGNADDTAPEDGAAGGSTGGWGGIFGDQASGDTWKCESCMVRNAASATACAACETPKPGLAESSAKGATAASSGTSAAAGASIGAGGFSFGGGSAPAPGGFSFGGGSAPAPATTGEASKTTGPSISTSGFSFAGGSTPSSGFSFGSSQVQPSGSSSFSFGGGSMTNKVDADSSKASESKPTSGGASKDSTSSAYPPIASKSPTPFGGNKASAPAATTGGQVSSKPSGASGYPPISSKAPTPFSGKKAGSAAPSKSGGASSYPPLSSTAPSPFSAPKASAPAPSKTSGPSAYPPLSSKAPVPFGGSKASASAPPAVKGLGSSAFPPLSTKAPVPFGGNKASAPAPSKSAYPPLSSKAPVPFGGGKPSAAAPAAKGLGSSTFPPVASKAPTPFSASLASTPAPSKSSGQSAYPPLSSKAPVPFGGTKPSASAPAAKGLGSSAFPPLSSKAPVPFGGGTPSAKASAQSSFPPMVSKAPTPFTGGKSSTPAPATWGGKPTSTTGPSASTKEAPSQASSSWREPASSGHESQFRKVIESFQRSISSLADSRLSSEVGFSADGDSHFESDIEKLVDQKDSQIASCTDMHSQITKQRERAVFLLSRKTDIERQMAESRRVIDEQAKSRSDQARVLETQPLDAESERSRRSIAVKTLAVNRLLELLENRNSLLRGVCDIRDESRTDVSVEPSQENRKNTLLLSVVSNFENTRIFEVDVVRTSNRVAGYAESIPAVPSTPPTQSGSSRRSLSGRRSKHRLTPVSLSAPISKRPDGPTREHVKGAEKWVKMEQTMRRTKGGVPVAKKLTTLARIGTASLNVKSQGQGRTARAVGPSLLLSPAGGVPPSSAGKMIRQQRVSFSSPLSKARPDWNVDSTFDQEKVKNMPLAFPQQLKKIDASEASRDALSRFGTTPEKTERALELKRSTKLSDSSNASSSKTSSSGAAFPPMSAKSPTPFSAGKSMDKGIQSKASSSYPPVAKQAPKPFSSNVGVKQPAASSAPSKPSEHAIQSSKPLSLQPKASFPSLARSTEVDEKKSDTKASPSAFGDLKGLGDSLFAADDKSSPEKSEPDALGLSLGAPLTADDALTAPTEVDYHTILVEFYTKHNPARLNEVDKTLERYKGREVEMFGKLARKYKVPSPLDAPNAGTYSSPATFGGPSAVKSPVAPMPTSASTSSSGPVFGSTASAPAQNAPPSPSPFGGPSTQSNALGQSPFGQSMTQKSAFGSTAASPSPFGAPTTSQASPFGPPAAPQTSPFGPPAATSQSLPFGQASASQPAAAPAPSNLIGGREPREVLVAFYQKYNPSKVNEVDKFLAKYKGNEEQMFRNLAKKYNLDPSMFGLSSNPPAPAPAFGQPSTGSSFGQTTQSFGGASTPGFGQPSTLGSGSTFGSPSQPSGGSAFGSSAIGGSQPTFGSLSHPGGQTTPFGGGGMQQAGGFGSMSSGTTSGFGGAFGSSGGGNPFGAPRR